MFIAGKLDYRCYFYGVGAIRGGRFEVWFGVGGIGMTLTIAGDCVPILRNGGVLNMGLAYLAY